MKLSRQLAVTFTVLTPIALVSGHIIHTKAFGFVAFMAWKEREE